MFTAFEYIEQLKKARKQARDEADVLKRDVEQVQQDLMSVWIMARGVNRCLFSNCQSQLPATGAPLNPARADRLRDQFDAYVKQRTLNNWKFWLVRVRSWPIWLSATFSTTVQRIHSYFVRRLQPVGAAGKLGWILPQFTWLVGSKLLVASSTPRFYYFA